MPINLASQGGGVRGKMRWTAAVPFL